MEQNSESKTTFEDRCNILSEIWLNYRADAEFDDFIQYNDLGLPLAYLIASGVIEAKTDQAKSFVNETFELLLAAVEVEDTGFETLDNILDK